MPLPQFPPALVQAPAWAGVGLRFKPRTACPDWPSDWWQRNFDEYACDELVCALTERQQRIPAPPVVLVETR